MARRCPPAISAEVKEQIRQYLSNFVNTLLQEVATSDMGDSDADSNVDDSTLKPFHQAIIPVAIRKASRFERSFSTRLGSTFEECARRIAAQHHAVARRNYKIQAEVSQAALEEINTQVATFESMATQRKRLPFKEMVSAVLSKSTAPTNVVTLSVISDLYVRKHDGKELFFEIKSPQPNKGQCLEVTQRLLRIHLLRGKPRPDVQAYFAMPYNPFGPSRKDYQWSYAIHYTPFDDAVLIGDEFWELLGGPSTYEELLAIYEEVGRAHAQTILSLFGV